MKFFHHSTDDVGIWINRCHVEAADGRVSLALERHRQLANEFPEDCHRAYDEGLIRRDYLGQGLIARDLFEKAYELATQSDVTSTRWFAACNAANLARDEQEFRRWASIAVTLAPEEHPDHEFYKNQLDILDSGESYQALLLRWSSKSK